MKVLFNFVSVAVFLATVLLLPTKSAEAGSTFYSTRDMLREFFPKSEKVTFIRYSPNRNQRASLAKQLGYRLGRTNYDFYVASTAGKIDGYAFIDDQMGQHQPITFAVQISPAGAVMRLEIMVYREPRGDEVRDSRFRGQFAGKTLSDPIAADQDIDCVSGATISSNAMAIGVRRALVLFDAAVTPTTSTTPTTPTTPTTSPRISRTR